VRRLLLSVVLVAVALAAQLTIVNRLALPGGGGPDLVLLVVVALALTGGPLPGMLTGFLAGLALDVAPPAGHTVGEYALVFCVVGYGCGRLAGLGGESPTLYVAISAGAAAVGAVLYAVLGVMLSDPQVTWSSVQHVLPSAVVYNVLLSPFVLFGVVKLYGWAGGGAGQEGPSAAMSSAAAGALGATGLATGAVRQASASGSPRLHLGDRRGSSDAWIGSARASGPPRAGGTGLGGSALSSKGVGGREPRLRFTGSGGGSGLGGSVGAGGAHYTPPKAAPRMNFGHRGLFGGRGPVAGRSGVGAPRSGATPRFRKRTMTGTIGTGGALSRATPRRGTFGRSRSFGQRGSLAGGGLAGRSGLSGRSGLGGRTGFSKRGGLGRRNVLSKRSGLGGRSGLGSRRGFGGRSRGRMGGGGIGRGSAPRLKVRRNTWRSRIGRLLGRNRGGF
jgi:rod shape-determining protein MreD